MSRRTAFGVRSSGIGVLVVAGLLAGCGKDEGSSSSAPANAAPADEDSGSSGARRIDGGTEIKYRGASFDIPRGWKKVESEGTLALVPDGSNPGGRLEELYIVAGDPKVTSLKSDAFQRSIEEAIGKIQPGAKLKEGPESRKFGGLKGLYWRFEAKAQDGKAAEIRAYGWMGSCGCALIALGYAEAIQKRDGDIQAILGSLSKPPKVAGGKGSVLPELAGTWTWITNFNANNGAGRQTDTTLILSADGTYRYKYEHVSTNPFGASWGTEHDSGTWTATDDSITFTSAGGSARTSTLEKRNHPKNTGDPMIILDGKTFVTALRKDPW